MTSEQESALFDFVRNAQKVLRSLTEAQAITFARIEALKDAVIALGATAELLEKRFAFHLQQHPKKPSPGEPGA